MKTGILNILNPVRMIPVLPDSNSRLCGGAKFFQDDPLSPRLQLQTLCMWVILTGEMILGYSIQNIGMTKPIIIIPLGSLTFK